MELYKVIKDNFNEIVNDFSLGIKEISDNETVIYSDDYILSFEMHSSELDFSYIERTKEGKLLQYYNFGSFVAYSAEGDNRNRINIMEISELEKQIKIYESILKNKFIDLLTANKSWVEEYKNFILYVPPRDVTEIKKDVYERLYI